jgi:S-DNA-T family DNA segregation ATPase FtsK/SpoIIIE
MPRSETSNSNGGRSFPAARSSPNWVAATACLLLGIFLTVAFADYSPGQSRFFNTNPTEKNIAGDFGATLAQKSFSIIGVATWLIPIFLFWLFYLAVRNPRRLVIMRFAAMVASLLAAAGLLALSVDFLPKYDATNYFPHGYGGVLGQVIYRGALKDIVGDFGTVLLLGGVYVVGLLFIFTQDIGVEIDNMVSQLAAWREARKAAKERQRAELGARKLEFEKRKMEARQTERAPLVLTPASPDKKNVLVAKAPDAPSASKAAQEKDGPDTPRKVEPRPDAKGIAEKSGRKMELNIVKPEETKKARAVVPAGADDDYKFPPLALLKEQVRQSVQSSEEEHRRNAENLLRILGEFGVEVSLGEIHVGPVITRYEVVPAAGVRVEKISGLDKNIALGMRAQSVRILAPIPGKAAVGVEVPNQKATPVGLREIIESEDWSSARAELPIALGKDVSGRPLISDLAKMPHLLIAGATGSGKSVCINAIVASILYSKSPRDVRLIMIDPKVVELKIFNALPHMLIPVLTEPKKVPAALKWLLREMEQRYQIFGKVNVRNITGFNHRRKGPKAEVQAQEAQASLAGLDPLAVDDGIEIPDHLPYIVVIVDELADLMMIAPAEIETNVARLAQLARAAGIHLIIATQRPSVNVVTGIIKANLPSRIAFQVASQIDSRTIIDTKGAETLIGRGDMLFTPPGSSSILRAQGAFVADDEMQTIVDYLKENNDPPVYAQAVQQHIDRTAREEDEDDGADDGENDEMGDDEELYQQALEVLKATRRASTSMLQRRLRIGYNRAARIMEIMEEKGIVGPENGSSPREILGDLDNL